GRHDAVPSPHREREAGGAPDLALPGPAPTGGVSPQTRGALTSTAAPRPEYPRPSMRRNAWVNLNGEWEFGSGPSERFDRRITVPFAPESELSGIRDWEPAHVVWYRRRFDAPPADRLLLHFGADDCRTVVWVNGE